MRWYGGVRCAVCGVRCAVCGVRWLWAVGGGGDCRRWAVGGGGDCGGDCGLWAVGVGVPEIAPFRVGDLEAEFAGAGPVREVLHLLGVRHRVPDTTQIGSCRQQIGDRRAQVEEPISTMFGGVGVDMALGSAHTRRAGGWEGGVGARDGREMVPGSACGGAGCVRV